MILLSVSRQTFYLSFKVRADPDNASLNSHLEGKTNDSSNLQQGLLTQAPSSLKAGSDAVTIRNRRNSVLDIHL